MAVAITAESRLDNPCPRAGITITGLTVGDSLVSVWRLADGKRFSVRGARRAIMSDAQFLTDYDAPLGRPVSYEVEVISGPVGPARVTSAPITIDTPFGWLQDPLVPQSAVAVSAGDLDELAHLQAQALSSLEYNANVTLIPVMGTDAPMGLFGTRQAASNIPLPLDVDSKEQNRRLKDLLKSTAQLLFRPVPSYSELELPGTMYVSVASVREIPINVSGVDFLTRWELKADTVDAPTMRVLTANFTYGDVAIVYATYGQKQTANAGKTYLDDLKSPL